VKKFYGEQEIIHETSSITTPQQNGRVERKYHHILNVARVLQFEARLLTEFWGECALTVANLINRTSLRVLNGKTPYEALFHTTPQHLLMIILEFLGVYVMHIIFKEERIDFKNKAKDAFLLGTHMGKKDERYMTLKLEKYL